MWRSLYGRVGSQGKPPTRSMPAVNTAEAQLDADKMVIVLIIFKQDARCPAGTDCQSPVR